MTKFTDRLYDDLIREHGHTLRQAEPFTGRRRSRRPAWAVAGALTATAAAALGFTMLGPGTAAYAVEQHGSNVTISLAQLTGAKGANAELRKLGVPIAVASAGTGGGCVPVSSLPIDRSPASAPVNSSAATGSNGSVTVDVQGVPNGDTALAVFAQDDGKLTGSIVIVKGTATPSCVTPDTAPGGAVTSHNG